MKNSFTKTCIASLGFFLGIFVLAVTGSNLSNQGIPGCIRYLVEHAKERHSYTFGQANGYYEALMTIADDESHKKFIPIESITLSEQERSKAQPIDIYQANKYLIYEAKPNLHFSNSVEGMVETNSYGFFDPEYSLKKLPKTRRIALFGDSVIRGTGVTYNQRFGNLLQGHLNASGEEHFEILNLSVPGYLLTQMYGEAIEKAPKFHPDVYVFAITDRTGNRIWGKYLAKLVEDGVDLRYDVLRRIASESGIKKGDSPEEDQWKLEPYRVSAMRAIFMDLKARVEQQSAKLVVILVPSAEERAVVDPSFSATKECLQGTGIPVVDVTDALYTGDLDNLRLDWFDLHPNAEGHRRIAENLYTKLQQNPEAWAAITGNSLQLASTH